MLIKRALGLFLVVAFWCGSLGAEARTLAVLAHAGDEAAIAASFHHMVGQGMEADLVIIGEDTEGVEQAAALIGFRQVTLLDQPCHSRDTELALIVDDWEQAGQLLRGILDREQYDVVVTYPPRQGLHPDQKATVILTLDAVTEMEEAPVVLASAPSSTLLPWEFHGQVDDPDLKLAIWMWQIQQVIWGVSDDQIELEFPLNTEGLAGYPLTQIHVAYPPFVFDKLEPVNLKPLVADVIDSYSWDDTIDYTLTTFENFWLFSVNGEASIAKAQTLMDTLGAF